MTERPVLLSFQDLRGHLEIRAGDAFSVCGPSGSGKTVLLRTLARLEEVKAEALLWRGQPVSVENISNYRASVIYVAQRSVMLGETVEQALRAPLGLRVHRGRAFDLSGVMESFSEFGKEASFLNQLCVDLSGGESQIVALIRALQLGPDLLLLDEPTGALDPQATEAAEACVRKWHRKAGTSRAYLWVTHQEAQAKRVGLDGMMRVREMPRAWSIERVGHSVEESR